MAEPPKMTEFEKVLAEQEKEEKQEPRKVRKVHWPAPGTGAPGEPGAPHGKTPPVGAPKLTAVPSEKPGGEHAPLKEEEERKPPVALIAALVLVLVVGGIVLMVVRGKGGSEAPAEKTDTAVQQPAQPPAKGPTPGTPPAPAKPAGGGGGGGSSPSPKPSAQASSPAKQPTKNDDKDVPRPSAAKISKAELEWLEKNISNEYLTYEKVVQIVGGEGRKLAADYDEGGVYVEVYEWPGEGLEKEYVHLKFSNGRLSEINLH